MLGLIKFQKKYRQIKHTIFIYNHKISYQKDYLLNMINNLSKMNNYKLYQDSDTEYISILSELKEIKEEINSYPPKITIRNYRQVYVKIKEINKLIIKYSNHITPENINYLFRTFINDNWTSYYSKDDIEKIYFITRFIQPITIWDSEYHKTEVKYEISNKDTQKNTITKDIIESLLGLKSNNLADPDHKITDSPKINSIIINSNKENMPSFLKTINELIELTPTKNNRVCHYTINECNKNLLLTNINITKNNKSFTLIEDKIGTSVFIRVPNKNKFIVIQGIFYDDLLNISLSFDFIKRILDGHINAINLTLITIPISFRDNYIKIISLRDIIVLSSVEIIEEIKKKYNDFKSIQSKPLMSLINEFLLASKYRKIDILSLLLISNDEDQKVAFILFDVFKIKDKKEISNEIYQSLHHTIRDKLDSTKIKVENEETELLKVSENDIPYERRISLMKTSDDVKYKAMEKLKSMKSSFQGDSKAQAWLDSLLKIPFNNYSQNEIISFKENFINKIKSLTDTTLFSDNDIDNFIKTLSNEHSLLNEWNNYKLEKKQYIKDVRTTLDNAVYGHKDAKLQLERIFAQWINGEAKGAVLGLQGPPGTGKTSLAKNGLSKCLKDKNGEPRPFAFLPIGGSVNGSTLVGHNFTYVGSTHGRIVDILIVSKCMNPIIFIDEVDKVSHTEHGREIISILTHLTDSTQNDEFEDKFFAGVKLDLSKALIVFSFNDPELIDPILRDRITIIETHPLTINEKLTIIRDYMIPEICKDVGFNTNEIILDDEMITYLIETYTYEAGVRKIKEKIVEIIRDINLNRFHSNDYELPFKITKDYVKRLFENKPKIRIKKIQPKPEVGIVNGLYATTSGIGGLTPVQVLKFPSTKMLELNITGKAGEVMKESIEYSLKNAFTLLPTEKQDKIIDDANNKKTFGLHIHFPDGATPKDGPSAGLAITLAFYSILADIPVKNDVCMTGEIDLRGNAGIIGGLESKLLGGKKAGCTLALIPKDNMDDLEKMRRENLSPEDDNFKVIPVTHINQVLEYALVQNHF